LLNYLLSVQEPVTRSYRNILFTKDGYKQVSAYGAPPQEDDGEPFEDKMVRLTATLKEQFVKGTRLESVIRKNLAGLGYEL